MRECRFSHIATPARATRLRLSKFAATEYAHAFFFVRKAAPACYLASQRQPHGAPYMDFLSTLIALLALAVLVAAVLNPLPRDERKGSES